MNPESQNWSRKRVPTVSTDTSLRAYQAFDLRSSSRGGGGRTATTFRRPVCLSYDGKHSCPPFDITISVIRPEPKRKRKIQRFCNNIHLLPSQKRKKVYLLTISREGWSLLRNKRREMRLLGQTNWFQPIVLSCSISRRWVQVYLDDKETRDATRKRIRYLIFVVGNWTLRKGDGKWRLDKGGRENGRGHAGMQGQV